MKLLIKKYARADYFTKRTLSNPKGITKLSIQQGNSHTCDITCLQDYPQCKRKNKKGRMPNIQINGCRSSNLKFQEPLINNGPNLILGQDS